ncbi:hypothetical protein, partial [Escherichia coli]|uniref:hypothetical protein n=1 Tax=Escherichia coli TaxID=562 RepID=UPI0034E6249B
FCGACGNNRTNRGGFQFAAARLPWFVIHAFVEALKAKAPMPIDIYDALAWSAITPLSEQSIAEGNRTLDFPDFTRGQWRTRKPIFALNDAY